MEQIPKTKEEQYSNDHEEEEEYNEYDNKEEGFEDQENKLLNHDKHRSKKANFTDVQIQMLLNTLNIIVEDEFHFENFSDLIQNDAIPRFVIHFLQIDSIKNVKISNVKKETKDQDLSAEEIQNINSVINYLKTLKLEFQIFKFNFENPKTRISSTILFYKTFLNLFFVKNSIKEMYDRLGVILCNSIDFNDYIDYSELIQLHTYTTLLHNTILKNFPNIQNSIGFQNSKFLFQLPDFTSTLSDDILTAEMGKYIYDFFFYQIQFIFNTIDSYSQIKILEKFMKAIYVLKKIRLPRFDILAKSIWAKRTSIELQNETARTYLNRKSSQSFSSNENLQSKENKKQIEKPKTYKERYNELNKSRNLNENDDLIQDENEEKLEKSGEFGSSYFKTKITEFSFDNGVIIYNKTKYEQNKKETQSTWAKEIENIKKKDKKKERKSSKMSSEQKKMKERLSFKSSQNSFITKLYKIFYYDEQNDNWCFDSDVFDQFSSDKRINISNSNTPVVLFINSYQNDCINIVSNMINGIFPILESEEQIFVYAFCDKTLALLNFTVDFQNKEKGSVKPIFLLLHVPKSKENLPNIQQIVFRIYSFLSLMCDLEIVVLNKDHYIDQIEFIKAVKEISISFSFKKNIKTVETVNSSKNQSNSNVNSDGDNDDDEEFETWDKNSDNDEDDFVFQTDDENISKIKSRYFKIIILVNDTSIESFNEEIETKLNSNKFFTELKSQINDSQIHFINPNIYESYEAFLKGFNDVLMIAKSTFADLKSNFQCIKLSELNPLYIELRSCPSIWKKEIKKLIESRYHELQSSQKKKGNSFILLSRLRNEISSVFPSFDEDFKNEYKKVLSDLKQESNKTNHELFITELGKSSNLQLSYIQQKITNKYFFSNETIDNVLKSHIQFLKDEFFDIIQLNSPEKVYNMIYEDNIDILHKQIENDSSRIKSMFESFIKMNENKNVPKQKDILEGMKKGTNYSMKETENLKEIKVTVEVNSDLESIIEQDF